LYPAIIIPFPARVNGNDGNVELAPVGSKFGCVQYSVPSMVNVPAVEAVVTEPVTFIFTVAPDAIVIPYPAFANVPCILILVIVDVESVILPACVSVYPDAIDSVPLPEGNVMFVGMLKLFDNARVPFITIDEGNILFPENVNVYPEAIVNVPAPDTVDTEYVAFPPTVSVYPELIETIPVPDIEVVNVTFPAIVKVYEPISIVPEPLGGVMFVGIV